MAKDNYREKTIGPLNFVYAGTQHVGNVIEPILGGKTEKAMTYTAVSKSWGKQTTHNSKNAALAWLKARHGDTMKTEQIQEETETTQDVLRNHGWKKAMPYAFHHHLISHESPTFVHPDLPGHKVRTSYRDSIWSHVKPNDPTAITGGSAGKLHAYLQKLHGSKQESTLRNFVSYAREEFPEDWKEQILDTLKELRQPIQEERYEGAIEGQTPHSIQQRAIKRSKISVVKKDPNNLVGALNYNSVQEELEDWEKNRKDPSLGPKIPGLKKLVGKKEPDPTQKSNPDVKQGPAPVPSKDAESELTIKRTMTGEPGPTIEINPDVRDGRGPNLSGNKGPQNSYTYVPDPEHKKSAG